MVLAGVDFWYNNHGLCKPSPGQKHFLAIFNTQQAPLKKKKKIDAEQEAEWLSYELTGHVRKFIPEWKKEFKWLRYTANGMTCNICKSFEKIGSFIVGCTNYRKSTISKAQSTTGPQDQLT